MLHHVSLGTNDLKRAKEFYVPVLATLGMELFYEDANSINFGSGSLATLTFSVEKPFDGKQATAGNGVHIAFLAEGRGAVEEFYRTALAHGGKDDGAPGIRNMYDPHYYAAFVFDPEGNKIEAVTFSAQQRFGEPTNA